MGSSEESSTPSTPLATAALVQREVLPADEDDSTASPQAREGKDFRVGDYVTRPFDIKPYERRVGDPIYRPLRIFSLDPAASRLEGAEAVVNVPYETLAPGPVGGIFAVDDKDDTQGTHWGRVDLDARLALLSSGHAPSTANPLFHQQMVYAVCSTVYAAFRRALGRQLGWGFEVQPGTTSRQLRIRPHAFDGENASYDRQNGELAFGYFQAPPDAEGRTPPGGVVFTCLSHDIVAHEVTHALLDGLRAHFAFPSGPDVLGFHEGFADLVAVFQRFSYREVVQSAVRRAGTHLHEAGLLTGIAQQFGQSRGGDRPLRSAFEALVDDGGEPKAYRDGLEAHECGEILVQAVFEAMRTVFERKIARYLRLATGGTGRLPPGDVPADLQEILSEEASRLASHFLAICIRAIDYCPPVDIRIGEYLRALITADYELVADDKWAYREALIDAFRARGIYPPQVQSLSEESVRWQRPELSVKEIEGLHFKHLKFEGDPAAPAGRKELERQARALGSVLGSGHNVERFGLARPGAKNLSGDAVSVPRVESIRSSRRVGPDGQVVFDLVAEVTQRRTVRDPSGTFDYYGGATVIIGPKGEFRYVIAKSILNNERLKRQSEFVHGGGARYWERREGGLKPVANAFRMLHHEHHAKAAK